MTLNRIVLRWEKHYDNKNTIRVYIFYTGLMLLLLKVYMYLFICVRTQLNLFNILLRKVTALRMNLNVF